MVSRTNMNSIVTDLTRCQNKIRSKNGLSFKIIITAMVKTLLILVVIVSSITKLQAQQPDQQTAHKKTESNNLQQTAIAEKASKKTQEKAPEVFAFELVEINESVTVALKPAPHRMVDSNIVIIKNKHNLVIVDANDNLINAQKLIDAIKQRYQLPVHYVVNTHWHTDHVLANQLYQQAFTEIKDFVAHKTMISNIKNKSQEQLEQRIEQWQKAMASAEEKIKLGTAKPGLADRIERGKKQLAQFISTKLIAPTLTFNDQLILPQTSQKIELIHYGRAHTNGDTIVYLPEQKVLIAGDLFDHLPYAGHGYPSEWLQTLKQIEKLNFNTVIPGHGAIQHNKKTLQLIIRLLTKSIKVAKQAVITNKSQKEFMQSLDMEDYREWFGELDDLGERTFKRFIPEFFEQAFVEAERHNRD
jgi:cyclase